MGLAGIPFEHRHSGTISLIGFVPKPEAMTNCLDKEQREIFASLKSLMVAQTMSIIIKEVSQIFLTGIYIRRIDGTLIKVHPFVLTCITDGPGNSGKHSFISIINI